MFYTSGALSIQWHGLLKGPITGNVELVIDTDDNARIWLDGTLVVDWYETRVNAFLLSSFSVAYDPKVVITLVFFFSNFF